MPTCDESLYCTICLIFWVSHAVRPMKIATPANEISHSRVLLPTKMLTIVVIIKPISAINRNEPIFVRSLLVR